MSQSSTIACLLALALIASAASAAPQTRELMLCDFETNEGGLNLGGEFPGAEGQFNVVAAAAHDGKQGARLSFDLTKGAYVAWGLELPTPLVAGARSLSVWVRADAAGRRVHCKTRDATGQDHMRTSAVLPVGQWQHLSFPVEKIDAHWGGANDGKLHWPITYVQLGVEPGPNRIGATDLDTLTVTTTATPHEQSGVLKVTAPHFGNLFAAGETPTFGLATGMLDVTPRRSAGMWRVFDWQDKEAAHGKAAIGQPLALVRLPAGCFRLDLDLHDTADAAIALRASTWFGVLSGPNPPPCSWVGTVTHGGHGWDRGDLRYLDLLSAAGIGVVRDEFGWSSIEKTKGRYATSPVMEGYVDGLKRHGIKLNLLLSYGNGIYATPLDPDAFARWAGWMARHYQGRVNDFEIWNEPGNFFFPQQYPGQRDGKPAWVPRFVELTKKAGAAIRAARPDATIVLCAEDGWGSLQAELSSRIGTAGDVIAIHPYCHEQPRPEREWFFRDGGAELRRLSRANGGPRRVVITEAGWTTYEGTMKYLAIAGGYPRSSLVHQAQYLVRMYLSARAAGVDYSTQYDFRDDGSNRSYTEENFGLLHQDYSPKPSLLAVAAMTRLVGQGRFVRDAAPDPATARAYVFDVGGTAVVCAYAVEKDTKLTLSVGTDRLEQADLMGNRSPLAAPGGRVTLDLTERPIYLVGARLVSLAP
jgi:hypothetical protein